MKTVVLGFDGVEPSLYRRLADAGSLPELEHLADKGTYSTIDSTVVPISAMAWNSFATGVNPGKHGVFDFITRSNPDSAEFDLTTSNTRQAPAMWDYLAARDRQTGVVGMPVTYPVDELAGFMISGYPTPYRENSFWPPNLPSSSPVDPGRLTAEVHFDGTNRQEFIEDQLRQFDAIREFHAHALRERDWDTLVTVFKQTDDVAHVAWDEPALHEVYERADEVVGETREYLESLDEEYLLIVLSDHGFGPVKKTLFLNNVLRDLDYVTLKDRVGTRLRDKLSENGLNMLTAYRVASKLGLGERLMSVGFDEDTLKARALYALRNTFLAGAHDIDVAESACFSRGNYGQIFVADDTSVDDVEGDLLEYRSDGERIVEDVHRADEHFHGDAMATAPDVMIETPNYEYLTARGFAMATREVLTDHIIGRDAEHKQEGVFFATGSSVDSDSSFAQPDLEDILPTVLYALGEPIPRYLDGDPIDLFDSDLTPEFAEYDVNRGDESGDLSDEEASELRSQLESLGYAN